MSELKIIPLKCPGCGAKLEVSDDMERFACGYCGTELITQRRGGTIALKPVTDAIARVQAGTDRTAAELALQRLQSEMNNLKQQRQARNEKWNNDMDQLSTEYLEQVKRSASLSSLTIISLAIFIIVAVIAGNLGATSGAAIIPGLIVAAGAFVALFLRQQRIDAQRVNQHNSHVAANTAELEHDLAALDPKIKDLNARIEERRRIADA